MIEEPFANGSSFFHRCHTGVKIIGALLISLVLALNSSLALAIIGLAIGISLLFVSCPPVKILARRFFLVNVFTLFLWLTLPLTYGENIASGVEMALLISLKTNGILFCFLALVATSRAVEIGHGLITLGVPDKLAFLLLFSYRQLFVIYDEYMRLQRAAKLRGFIPVNTIHTYKTYGHLFGMTLVRSWNRAERIRDAMVLRGFNGRIIPMDQAPLRHSDVIFLSALVLGSLLFGSLAFFHGSW